MIAGHTTRTWVRRCASRHADRTIAGWACTRWIVKEVADVLVVGPIAVACPHPQTTIATSTAAHAGQRRFICTESYVRSGDTPEHWPTRRSCPSVEPDDAHEPPPCRAALGRFRPGRMGRRATPAEADRRADASATICEPSALESNLSSGTASDLLDSEVAAVHRAVPGSARRHAPSTHRRRSGVARRTPDHDRDEQRPEDDRQSFSGCRCFTRLSAHLVLIGATTRILIIASSALRGTFPNAGP